LCRRSIGRKLYDRLVEQLRLVGQQVSGEPGASSDDKSAPGLPATWDDIAAGHLVIAQEGLKEGWWEAIVLGRDGRHADAEMA
jgi:hypothetical protein